MIANKFIGRLCVAIMAILVFICLGLVLFRNQFTNNRSGIPMAYESKIFNTDEIISLNIIIDSKSWDDMLKNSLSEKYYRADVEINGELFRDIGVRTKGNTSLTSIAKDPNTNRYSFKIEFDQFINGQSYHGLDKLTLNNSFADNTNMKEALIYDMYKFIGADSPLYNYAKISINGEYWGVYLAVESVEDSFLLRNYGTINSELYKPDRFGVKDNEELDKEDIPLDFPDGDFLKSLESKGEPAQGFRLQEENFEDYSAKTQEDLPNLENGRRPAGFVNEYGADLNYLDENLESYSTIWEGSITKSNRVDHKRVVTALKNIFNGNEIEKYMDVNNLVKYMAVHIFSVNEDSLSGSMAHNYYLHEYNGMLNLIPWDYNLIFGGMGARGETDPTKVINSPINTPFHITDFFKPLITNKKYLDMYHDNLSKLVEKYIKGGELDKFYNRTRNLIDSLVKDDPNAFVDYESYDKASKMLYDVVKLRGESVLGQINGTIPSTLESQEDSPENLIDASHINLEVMGTLSTVDMMGEELKEENIQDPFNKPQTHNPNPIPQDHIQNFKPPIPNDNNPEFDIDKIISQNQMSQNPKLKFLNKYFNYISVVISIIFGFLFVILYKRKLF